MKGFVQGADRQQTTLLPECLDDWVDESNPVRAVDVFVDALELRDLGFDGVQRGSHPQRTLPRYIAMFVSCHFQTHPLQQREPYSITSVARASKVGGW